MANINELFDQLGEFKWREISFPATTFRVTLRQDLAQHKFPDRDGAHIEATGRAPLEFSARIPFLNSIVPGKVETWGVLYPTQFRLFLAACADRTTGLLRHPELGAIRCKVESCDTVWDANVRAGVYVDVSWIESTFDPDESNAIFESTSPVAESLLAATDLDASIEDIQPAPPELPEYSPSFADSMRSLQAVGDQISLLSRRVSGIQDQVSYRANAIVESIGRATTSLSAAGVPQTVLTSVTAGRVTASATVAGPAALLWPLAMSGQRTLSAIDGLRKVLGTARKNIALYVVPKDSTLAGVASDVGASLSDLLKLNPTLVAGPVVTAKTIVRHYV